MRTLIAQVQTALALTFAEVIQLNSNQHEQDAHHANGNH